MTEPTRNDVEAAAYTYLARRDHGRGELKTKLLRKDFPPALVEDVLDTLEEAGYVDDRKFACHQGSILARKSWGPLQIGAKLRARGVSSEVIDEALAEISAQEDFSSHARHRLQTRFGEASSLDDKTRQKAFRHLIYRGYPSNLVRRLLFDFHA